MKNSKSQRFLPAISFLGFGFLFFGISSGTGHAKYFPYSKADTAHAATDSILKSWLKTQCVDDDKPVTKTLWLWTSPGELDSIEKQHNLLRDLSADDCPSGFETNYRIALTNKKWNNNPFAQLLRSGKFARNRSAWTCLWQGLSLYKDTAFCKATQLVQVNLEDSALIVSFRPGEKNCWTVFDLRGNIISAPEFEKRKSQVAVVYYSEYVHGKQFHFHIRSFFLCNEAMIKSWHHATPGMQKNVAEELQYLLLLHAFLRNDSAKSCLRGNDKGKNVYACWKGDPEKLSVAQFFFRVWRSGSFDEPEVAPGDIALIINDLHYRWKNQTHPIERYPSKGIR